MPNSPPLHDDDRIRQLEVEIQALRERIAALEPTGERQPRSDRAAALLERRLAYRWSFRGEQWTGRVGLILLFLGLVFLFRYSVEQGWITPTVRVIFGAGLGAALLATGLRISRTRLSYGTILLAGSVATFYATGWAASYLYELFLRPVAFGWMIGVTVLAFGLARRYDQPALASLGAIGGFATPFLLHPGSETVAELVIYTTLVVVWTTALYIARNWRSVLWTYAIGSLAVLAVAAAGAEGGERWLLQAGLLIAWAAGAAYPFLHESRRSGAADPYPGATIPFALQLRLLGAAGSAAALAITSRVWDLQDGATGALFLAVAALYGAFAWMRTRTPNFVARSAAPVAGAMLATGTFLILGDGAARWFAVGLLGFLAIYGGRSARFQGLGWVGHGLFALLAVELLGGTASESIDAFGAVSWALIVGVALGAIAAMFVRQARVRLAYRATAHVLVLIWLAAQFGSLSDTSEWVTVAWGGYGAILVLIALEAGRIRPIYRLQAQAFAGSALGLAVLKLLLVDMAQVSALIRIPLFLGSGLLLLGLSALFQRSLPPPPGHGRRHETAPDVDLHRR